MSAIPRTDKWSFLITDFVTLLTMWQIVILLEYHKMTFSNNCDLLPASMPKLKNKIKFLNDYLSDN